jgi:hypothetical protein
MNHRGTEDTEKAEENPTTDHTHITDEDNSVF